MVTVAKFATQHHIAVFNTLPLGKLLSNDCLNGNKAADDFGMSANTPHKDIRDLL